MAASFAIRLLFIHATPDARWAYSAAFKGDALLWLDYAHAIQTATPFELGLPIHPPGTAYLVAWLWNGTAAGIPFLRAAWALLGALTVVLLWWAASRSFGPAVGLLAGVLAAVSTGLIVLSSSVNGEAPYLLLVIASLLPLEGLGARPDGLRAAAWGLLNALACLIRVEHVLAFGFITLWLAWRWWRTSPAGRRRALPALGVASLCFAGLLLPWQAHVWRAIQRFNAAPPAEAPGHAAALAAIEARTAFIAWDDAALRARDALPAFARRTASAFVAATVAHRGGRRVGADDFRILEEAFGSAPRPLAPFVFVSAYGPLNFALANHPAARGGFSRAALEDTPPLRGGPGRYPRELAAASPPDLTLAYPPHLHLVNDGYGVGASWIAANPGSFARLLARKLAIFGSGMTFGLTGYNLPLGLSGLRRAVDMVTPPSGWLPALWSLLLLGVSAFGVTRAWQQPALTPWLLYAGSKLLATALFFGYARQGALVLPVVLVLVALALEPWFSRTPGPRVAILLLVLLALATALEGVRFLSHPALSIGGRPIETVDPTPPDLFLDQLVEYR